MKKPMHFCFLIHLSRVYIPGDIRQKSIRHHVYIESRESVEEKRKKKLLLEIDFCFREQQQGGYRLSIIGNPIQFLNVRPILYNGPNIGHVSESQSKEESNRNHLWRGDGRVESSNSNLWLLLLLENVEHLWTDVEQQLEVYYYSCPARRVYMHAGQRRKMMLSRLNNESHTLRFR
jgi:hypothetical protein